MTRDAVVVAPAGTPITTGVATTARQLAAGDRLPAYIYDLDHLAAHLAAIRAAIDDAAAPVELLYAVKANPDPHLINVITQHVHGLEVASGGELAHVRHQLPRVHLTFGGPAKTDTELTAALAAGVDRFHVESRHELHRLNAAAQAAGRIARVLLRINLPAGAAPGETAALTMGGVPSPFGMDPAEADAAATDLARLPGVEITGVHAHLASGLGPANCAALAKTTLAWATSYARRHRLPLREVNVGGGMAVDYDHPDRTFDWTDFTARLATAIQADPGGPHTIRIEPGRAMSAYSGWYATRVIDLKHSHGSWFALCAGGTHHLRTPVAKGHNQPLALLPIEHWNRPWPRPQVTNAPITFVGQLCTPKDVFARNVHLPQLAVSDLVIFAMAGAYAYNISHHDFLMHPTPTVVHIGTG